LVGDDNADLEDYLGKFEFTTLYRKNSQELGVLVRQSFDSRSKNYLQIDWTFPIWGNIRGYAQYVNGYGESLIDYNAKIERFGLGILLSDLL
jgi:phospholipase A1